LSVTEGALKFEAVGLVIMPAQAARTTPKMKHKATVITSLLLIILPPSTLGNR
jgi:hypothetical protein